MSLKKMTLATLPPPVNVSPFIRFCRWSLLLTGVVYGIYHQNRFSKKETELRRIEAELKPQRDIQAAREKKRKFEDDMKLIDELLNAKKAA